MGEDKDDKIGTRRKCKSNMKGKEEGKVVGEKVKERRK